ncbi:PI-PLC X-box domain-containing protein [Tolypocladium ophioglossoides CBS 100239]|uniref:PI-PLC X-box domain-containing protein n=1 Tax=Tolypocladium ophioglossoides (strain CBS 100239) TaxID=1163406 RepID=A0A0L0NCF2_TOLOC|nr:PI-PLC X-box domain-containing protein [Tolypocladium ophioglossoides CBS 100239]
MRHQNLALLASLGGFSLAQAGVDTPLRQTDGCPKPFGSDPSQWTQYRSLEDLGRCDKPMVFDLDVQNLVSNTDTHIIIRACSPGRGKGSSSMVVNAGSNSIADNCGAKTKPVKATVQTWGSTARISSSVANNDISSAASQIDAYLPSQASCGSSITFAKSGNAVVGLYAGADVHRASASALVQMFQAQAKDGNFMLQFCETNSAADVTVGIFGGAFSDLGKVQDAVKTWTNGGCIQTQGSSSDSFDIDLFVSSTGSSKRTESNARRRKHALNKRASNGDTPVANDSRASLVPCDTGVEGLIDKCRREDRTYSTESPRAGSYMPWYLLNPANIAATGKQYITIVNLTPHRFKLDHTHSYQMDEFDFGDIPQGHARQNTAHYTERAGANPVDDNGEAYFNIEGTDKRFVIRATTHIPDHYWRRTVVDLSGMGMGQREYLDPGKESPVTLVITGSNDYGFITSIRHGPGNWMRGIYDVIKDRKIQHVIMPGTHDSGMSRISGKIASIGIPSNTQTQGINIYDQLRAGARWFDLRIATVHKVPNEGDYGFWVLHVNDEKAEVVIGNSGESLDDVVSEINRFTAENPGEVIFFRVRYLIGVREVPSLGPMYWGKDIVNQFFGKLKGVNNRCPNLDATPFNQQKASYFMDRNGGKGCVMLLLDGDLTNDVPHDSVGDGIYETKRMDFSDTWSNLPDTEPLANSQVANWKSAGRSGQFINDRFLISQWLVSADAVTTTLVSIQNIAILPTNPALYWMGVNNMSPESWPNVLMVDYIGVVVNGQTGWDQLSAEMYTLGIGMNLYMVSENCDISTQRSPLLPKPKALQNVKVNMLSEPWNGIIYANGTVQDTPPLTLHPGRVRLLKSGTRFLNGTVLAKDMENPDYRSTEI